MRELWRWRNEEGEEQSGRGDRWPGRCMAVIVNTKEGKLRSEERRGREG